MFNNNLLSLRFSLTDSSCMQARSSRRRESFRFEVLGKLGFFHQTGEDFFFNFFTEASGRRLGVLFRLGPKNMLITLYFLYMFCILFCMFDNYFLDICYGDRERERETKNYIYTFIFRIGRSILRVPLFRTKAVQRCESSAHASL